MQSEERQIAIPDLELKRCINCVRRLRRKGYSTSRVWVVSTQNAQGRIIRSLVMPESYQKCADTLVSRTRSHFRRLARYYHRIGTLHNCMSELNLSNYYWHESATMYIWETVEEMWLFNSQKKRKKIKQEESEIPEYI